LYVLPQAKYASWVPGIVFSALALVTGVLALVLPETLNRPLPETVKEVESWTRSIIPAPASPSAPVTVHGRSSPIPEIGEDENYQETSKM